MKRTNTFIGNLNNFKKTLENNKYNVIEFSKKSDRKNTAREFKGNVGSM